MKYVQSVFNPRTAACTRSQVSLYAQEKDERELLEFLQAARDPLGRPLYDAHFALRVARQEGHLHACVQLLCELNLHEVQRLVSVAILHGTRNVWQCKVCRLCPLHYHL